MSAIDLEIKFNDGSSVRHSAVEGIIFAPERNIAMVFNRPNIDATYTISSMASGSFTVLKRDKEKNDHDTEELIRKVYDLGA